MLSNHLFCMSAEGADDIEGLQKCAFDEDPQDESVSIDIPLLQPTFPADNIPPSQDSFIVARRTTQDNDNSGVEDSSSNHSTLLSCQSQEVFTEDVFMAHSSSTTVTYAMLKRVACELVDVTMKQNDGSNNVSVCGMMLRVTNLL